MSLIFRPFSMIFVALELGVFTATLRTPLVSPGDTPVQLSEPLCNLLPLYFSASNGSVMVSDTALKYGLFSLFDAYISIPLFIKLSFLCKGLGDTLSIFDMTCFGLKTSKSSPVSVEGFDDVSANWVQDDEVEEEDVKDTSGSLVGNDVATGLFKCSPVPVNSIKIQVLKTRDLVSTL